MSRETFKAEFQKLLATSYKVPELRHDTDISVMDSLGITEACVLVEEHLSIEVSFDEMRALKNYGELVSLLNTKAAE